MDFQLPALPYAKNALEPHLSAQTLELHYERGPVFDNAAQVWNHTFYWNGMTPGGGGAPTGPLAERIQEEFGSYEAFAKRFVESAVGLFGSGYVWLSYDPTERRLQLEALKDADNPLLADRIPLLNADVWEHAYYVDYQNERNRYAQAFLEHLVNWRFAEANLEKAAA